MLMVIGLMLIALLYLFGWVIYVYTKTQGKITFLELLSVSIILAAVVPEIGEIPPLSPNWRDVSKQ